MKKEIRLIIFSIFFILFAIGSFLSNLYLVTVPKIKNDFTEQECEMIKNELCIKDKSYLEISKILDYYDIIYVQMKIDDINACITDNAADANIPREEYIEILNNNIKKSNHQKNTLFETNGIQGLILNDRMSIYNVDGTYYLVMKAYSYNHDINSISDAGKRCFWYKNYSYID